MQNKQLNSNVVILGGGTAGWLTALFISRNWPSTNITVVEDPNRPPIIAGESGTTTFASLLRHLKIDNNDFIKSVNATPKLGGKFTDWNGVGTEFIHCLQTDYAPWLDGWTDYVNTLEDTENLTVGILSSIMDAERSKDAYLKTLIGNNVPLANAFFANAFIKENKVPFGATSDIPCIPMWHFESRSAAAYFKQIGLSRNITLVEGEYQSSTQNEKGDITSITLNTCTLEGEWFFDCSGFSRLLLGGVYKEPIVDYTNYFPARSVVAWWDETCPCVTTNAISMKYGWAWNINIRHRSGNGYIFDPDHITLDQAIDEASIRFGKPIEPIANFSFIPGMMRKAWRNNVFAIGLSSGFLEPLEANGIAVIVESLFGLQDYWDPKQKDYDESIVKRFNDRIWFITEDIRDFLALHYRGHRSDTEFWKSHNVDSFRIPDSLKEKLAMWREFYEKGGPEPYIAGYSPAAWLMVLQGLQIFDYKIIAESNKKMLPLGLEVLNINEQRYKSIVDKFWTIDNWITAT